MPGRELRAPWVARIERNRTFSNFETLRGRNDDHVAMPVGSHWQAVHDLPTVRLDAVQVLDLHVEQQSTEPVINAGDECLLVLPFLEAGDHVGFIGEDGRHEPRNVLRLELEIRWIEDEDAAGGMQVARAQRVGDAAAAPVSSELQERISSSELLEHRPGVVCRAVVDDDDLERDVGLRAERRVRLLHEKRKVLRLVLRGDEYGDVGFGRGARDEGRGNRCAHGALFPQGRTHTRFRIRADSTPNWSRYLATVRRAIWTPLSFRMLTMA